MPTARGWGVAAAAVLSSGAGWWFGYPELAVPGVAGILALAVAVFWVVRSPGVEVIRDLAPERVSRGEAAIAVLTCSQRGRRGWAGVHAVDRFGRAEISVPLPAPRRGESATTSYPVPTAQRGDVVVGPLRLVTTDPFGLLSRSRTHGGTRTLRVLPRTVSLAAAPSGRLRSPDGPGADRAAGSVAFHTLRQYEFGDDLRQIHWRTSARTGTLMVRALADTSLPRTVVVLDARASAYCCADDFELAVDVAASVTLAAARPGFPLVLACGGQVSGRLFLDGHAAPAVVLDRLAAVRLSADDDESPMAAVRSARGRGALSFVTGDVHPTALDGLEFDAVTVVRVGAAAHEAPHAGRGTQVLHVTDLDGFRSAWHRRTAR
ncbi:DUF58 domain-containing protein [Catenulispora rubra]|uniref:DUF58 domain-containing protein n=1 Tax=Catenulispora rubra TaxID=280293 RepID=UPI0018922AB1|nr:DUF58 domain-containing protein [Catenulispora rubra]